MAGESAGFDAEVASAPCTAFRRASLTENDGTTIPVAWRSISGDGETLPLYPSAEAPWIINLANPAHDGQDALNAAVGTS